MSRLTTIVRLETRNLFADRGLRTGVIVFVLLAVYATLSGMNWMKLRQADAVIAVQQSQQQNAGYRQDLAAIERDPGMVPGMGSFTPHMVKLPTAPQVFSALPTRPLALIASSVGELQPQLARMSASSDRQALLEGSRSSTQNPMTLTLGRLDMVFLLTAVLPLMLLAFSFNLLSAEREQGTLALLLAQPLGVATLLLGKLLTRALLLLVPVAVLVPAGLFLASDASLSTANALDYLGLMLFILSYGAFWLLLAGLINARGGSSAANAMGLAGLWLLFVLVLPSLLNIVTESVYPKPRSADMTNELRSTYLIAKEKKAELYSNFALQHPEQVIVANIAAEDIWYGPQATLKNWLVRQRSDALAAPVVERFERRLGAQQQLAERWRFVSPAMVFQSALTRLAGVDAARTRAFSRAARDHLDALRAMMVPKILAGQKLVSGDYDRLPVFSMPEPSNASKLAADGLGIALPGLFIIWLLASRLRRYRLKD